MLLLISHSSFHSTGFWQGYSNHNRYNCYIPPQWFPKMPNPWKTPTTHGAEPCLAMDGTQYLSLLVTMFLVCNLISSSSYVLAKKRFYGQRILFAIFIAAMALPKQVVLVPLAMYCQLHGNPRYLWAVILPLIGWPFGVFPKKQFSSIHRVALNQLKSTVGWEICTFLSVAWLWNQVCSPCNLTFINTWNDYHAIVMLTSRNNLTISLGAGRDHAGWNGNQLWFDYGRSCPCRCSNRSQSSCLSKILHTGYYFMGAVKG